MGRGWDVPTYIQKYKRAVFVANERWPSEQQTGNFKARCKHVRPRIGYSMRLFKLSPCRPYGGPKLYHISYDGTDVRTPVIGGGHGYWLGKLTPCSGRNLGRPFPNSEDTLCIHPPPPPLVSLDDSQQSPLSDCLSVCIDDFRAALIQNRHAPR